MADRSKMFYRGARAGNNRAKPGGACHISSSARVRKSLSTRGSVDRVVTRYGNIQRIHLVRRERTCSASQVHIVSGHTVGRYRRRIR